MRRTVIVLMLLGVMVLTAVTLAGPQTYSISWWSIDSGGGELSGGEYALNGTIGQFDAQTAVTGRNYAINSGYWQGGQYQVFLPLVIR